MNSKKENIMHFYFKVLSVPKTLIVDLKVFENTRFKSMISEDKFATPYYSSNDLEELVEYVIQRRHGILPEQARSIFEYLLTKLKSIPGTYHEITHDINDVYSKAILYAIESRDTPYLEDLIRNDPEFIDGLIRYRAKDKESLEAPMFFALRSSNVEAQSVLLRNGAKMLNIRSMDPIISSTLDAELKNLFNQAFQTNEATTIIDFLGYLIKSNKLDLLEELLKENQFEKIVLDNSLQLAIKFALTRQINTNTVVNRLLCKGADPNIPYPFDSDEDVIEKETQFVPAFFAALLLRYNELVKLLTYFGAKTDYSKEDITYFFTLIYHSGKHHHFSGVNPRNKIEFDYLIPGFCDILQKFREGHRYDIVRSLLGALVSKSQEFSGYSGEDLKEVESIPAQPNLTLEQGLACVLRDPRIGRNSEFTLIGPHALALTSLLPITTTPSTPVVFEETRELLEVHESKIRAQELDACVKIICDPSVFPPDKELAARKLFEISKSPQNRPAVMSRLTPFLEGSRNPESTALSREYFAGVLYHLSLEIDAGNHSKLIMSIGMETIEKLIETYDDLMELIDSSDSTTDTKVYALLALCRLTKYQAVFKYRYVPSDFTLKTVEGCYISETQLDENTPLLYIPTNRIFSKFSNLFEPRLSLPNTFVLEIFHNLSFLEWNHEALSQFIPSLNIILLKPYTPVILKSVVKILMNFSLSDNEVCLYNMKECIQGLRKLLEQTDAELNIRAIDILLRVCRPPERILLNNMKTILKNISKQDNESLQEEAKLLLKQLNDDQIIPDRK